MESPCDCQRLTQADSLDGPLSLLSPSPTWAESDLISTCEAIDLAHAFGVASYLSAIFACYAMPGEV